MKNYVLLTCMVMSGFIVEASQDPAPKRNLRTDEEVRYVKELVRNDGPQAFIDALTAGEFDEEIYEMPLDDIKVQVQDSQTSLADILLGLNSMDYTFERIQSAFFSKRHGLEYLKRCLADVANLSAMNQFLQKCPWALNYLNPFKVLTDTYSLGYYVEIGLLRKDRSALAIKDLYGNHWDVHFKREMIDAEKGLLEIERITATLLDLYHQKGINGVINGLQRYDLNDADKKVDLGAITVPVGGVDTPLIKLIKEECRSGNQGAQIIYAKYVSNNVQYFDRLLEEAFTTKNYETVADEIVCCPTLARYLFRPEIMLDLQVDQLDATGDRHAQAIKSAVGPYEWDQLREYYKDARHLRICFNKGKLDDEGRQILAQVNSDATVANYVARLKNDLA